MSELNDLHRAIVAHPGDDAPRLMYADALLERGNPGDEEMAEFVKLQIELAAHPPRPQIHASVSYMGPNFYAVSADAEFASSVEIGDRVDSHEIRSPYDKRVAKVRHGLVVTRKIPEEDDFVRLALKKDEYSAPLPVDRLKEIEARLTELFRAHAKKWCTGYDHHARNYVEDVSGFRSYTVVPGDWPTYAPQYAIQLTTGGVTLFLERGFATRARASMDAWLSHGPVLCDANPIDAVDIEVGRYSGSGFVANQSLSDPDMERLKTNFPRVRKWKLV